MTNEQRTLRQLIGEGMYVIDEETVARAIVARANVNETVAHAGFRSRVRAPRIRSFRPVQGSRSFRLVRSAALHIPN
jgi:hypothetical protein